MCFCGYTHAKKRFVSVLIASFVDSASGDWYSTVRVNSARDVLAPLVDDWTDLDFGVGSRVGGHEDRRVGTRAARMDSSGGGDDPTSLFHNSDNGDGACGATRHRAQKDMEQNGTSV